MYVLNYMQVRERGSTAGFGLYWSHTPQPSALRIFPVKTNDNSKTETGELINQIKMTIDGKGKAARRREVAAV
jgi:hypothetical protein